MMAYERSEFMKMLEKKAQAAKQAPNEKRELRAMGQAAVAVEKMTSDQSWNFFLQICQYRREVALAQLDMVRSKILDPSVLNSEELMKLKVRLSNIEGRLATLEEVIDIPRQVKEDGAEALRRLTTGDS